MILNLLLILILQDPIIVYDYFTSKGFKYLNACLQSTFYSVIKNITLLVWLWEIGEPFYVNVKKYRCVSGKNELGGTNTVI